MLIATRSVWFSTVLFCAFIAWILPSHGAAQGAKPAKRVVIPRVGTIKDYPATGLMTGCGNLYFYHEGPSPTSDSSYVFLSRGDGSNAWMNLGGRDVRLRQLKRLSPESRSGRRYYYGFGSLRISVDIRPFRPGAETIQESDSMFRMTITLRRGAQRQIVKAIGDSDC
ncbi:MAG TPA: hypothetical protein VMS31_18430 [Pyrinomonadaceae bacterium]|nr:hypothetical protein [Pyrinomonadaceae bacterium]